MKSSRERNIRQCRDTDPERYAALQAKDRAKWLKRRERVKADPELTERWQERERGKDARSSARQFEGKGFVALDGEGWDLPNGRHVLTVLGSSHAPAIYAPDGLGTEACLEYCLALAAKGRDLVGFRFSYDVNMMLCDLEHNAVAEICQEGWGSFHTDTACYRLRYTPNKSLYVVKGRYQGGEWTKEKSCVIWDVFGFFQSSFLAALKEWGVGTEEEIALIDSGKQGRQTFDESQSETIIRYNDLECALLVQLMDEVKQALLDCDIRVSRWDGAGAIANSLHRKMGSKRYMPLTPQPEEVIRRAFYGARVQRLKVGDHYNVWAHDINSAYPSTIVDLPNLSGGEWVEVGEYDPVPDCAIWEVSWNVGDKGANPNYPLTPFPWRHKSEGILYPYRGRGVYWASLVRVALAGWGDRCKVVRGWVFHPADATVPFAWVRDLYELRKVCRDTGKGKILKLGYNSLYGKFAQGVGYHKGKPPAYQNYTWAGMITAHCQARVLKTALQSPTSIVAIATDGVFSTKKLTVPESKELGEWEVKHYDRFFILQPGVYAMWKDGKVKVKTRGFSPKDLPLDDLLLRWEADGPLIQVVVTPNRFIGMHVARAQHKLGTDWRQWRDLTRILTVASGSGIPDMEPEFWGPSMVCHPMELDAADVGKLPELYVPKGQVNDVYEQHSWTMIDADQG